MIGSQRIRKPEMPRFGEDIILRSGELQPAGAVDSAREVVSRLNLRDATLLVHGLLTDGRDHRRARDT